MEAVRRQNMFSKLTLFYAGDHEADATGKGQGGGGSSSRGGRGPMCLVRGEGQYVYDEEGRRYLDCVNNVRTDAASPAYSDSF
jgi:4-aminobutyrate aminotransferase-like enzyme